MNGQTATQGSTKGAEEATDPLGEVVSPRDPGAEGVYTPRQSFSEAGSSPTTPVGSPAPLLAHEKKTFWGPVPSTTASSAIAVQSGVASTEKPPPKQDSCFLYTVITVLTMIYFAEGGVENAISPCVLTTMQAHFNSTSFQIAAAQRMAEVAKTGSSIFLGHVAVRNKLVYVGIGTLVFAGGAFLVGISPKLWFAGIGYFTYGIGYATTIVLTPPVINDVVADKARGAFYIGMILAVLALGLVFFFVICALHTEKWRIFYIIVGAAPLIPTGILVLTQRSKIFTGKAKEGQSLPQRLPFFKTMWEIIAKRKVIMWMTIAQVFAFFYIGAFTSFIPKYVEIHYGKSKQTAGLVLGAMVPAISLAMFLGGIIVRKMQLGLLGMTRMCCLVTAFTIPWATFAWFAPSLGWFIALMSIAMFATFIPASPSYACLPLAVVRQEQVAYANSIVQFISRLLGAVAGPLCLGLMIDNKDSFLGFRGAFVFVGAVGTICSTGSIMGAWYCYSPEEYPHPVSSPAAGTSNGEATSTTNGPTPPSGLYSPSDSTPSQSFNCPPAGSFNLPLPSVPPPATHVQTGGSTSFGDRNFLDGRLSADIHTPRLQAELEENDIAMTELKLEEGGTVNVESHVDPLGGAASSVPEIVEPPLPSSSHTVVAPQPINANDPNRLPVPANRPYPGTSSENVTDFSGSKDSGTEDTGTEDAK